MKTTTPLYISMLWVALCLSGCGTDLLTGNHTVGEADNAIRLQAGIDNSTDGATVTTRAGAEDNHAKHVAFSEGTQLALQVIGTWNGNSNNSYTLAHGTLSNSVVTQTTTASIGSLVAGTDDKHRSVDFSAAEQLYWDDYGTADPDNTAGRTAGLQVYGAAVDALTTAPTVGNWTSLFWNVGTVTDGLLDETGGWADKDLLISNNVKDGTGDGTYKFDEIEKGKLLEFRHAMSKVTVRLIAGNGFSATNTIGATERKFQATPVVVLTSNEGAATTATEWPCTTATVNIQTGDVTAPASNSKVKMHMQSTSNPTYTAIYDALVVPGSVFGGDDDAVIARINADDNIYYVTAAAIRKAIKEHYNGGDSYNDYATKSGINYILNVTVNKTGIKVTATLTDWTDIEAEEVQPVINVNASVGDNAQTAFDKNKFSFYRSTSLDNGYSNDLQTNNYYANEAVVVKAGTTWDFTDGTEKTSTHDNAKPLYWPTHNTHYQFRGVWPLTSTETTTEGTAPHVELNNGIQVIKVKNVKYATGTFPSDLAIARPNVAPNAMCTNTEPGHTKTNLYSGGICATEGTVNLNFNYMMSKVEVNLTTSAEGQPDRVNLTGAKVEITNLYTAGEIKLGDRGAITTGSTAAYETHATDNGNQRLDAIVPQPLTFTTAHAQGNVRFKVTITNADGTQDVYYADVAPILKKGSSEKVAPNGKWEAGEHYIYNLTIRKTGINVTATLTDWQKTTADEDVWF